MKRLITVIVVAAGLLGAGLVTAAWTAELKVIQTQTTKDAVIVLKSETGQWKQGKNAFVLEFTSPSGQPLDVGKVTLSTSMAMPGMAPMVAGAMLSPDKAPGRYLGTIDFPDSGTRQVTVTWDGPAGKGSANFSVPVR
jgi:YtkA-like protein